LSSCVINISAVVNQGFLLWFLGRHPYYITGLHRGAVLHGHRQGQEDFRPPDDRQRGGSSR
jgi:hypothetical protein